MLALSLPLLLVACLNEVTMEHDEAAALVAKARRSLERAEYADAAKVAQRAAHNFSRRVAIGEGEAFDRPDVPRWKDAAALATARTIIVAAVVRSNANVDVAGKATLTPAKQHEAYQDAYALILKARKAQPKLKLAREVEAELQVRSGNLRSAGKATLLELAADDLLGAPEAYAALATLFETDGKPEDASRYRKVCASRAASPIQCAPFPPGIADGSGGSGGSSAAGTGAKSHLAPAPAAVRAASPAAAAAPGAAPDAASGAVARSP